MCYHQLHRSSLTLIDQTENLPVQIPIRGILQYVVKFWYDDIESRDRKIQFMCDS